MATVLVADDEPDVCYLVSVYLRRAGHHVIGASDGAAVIDAVHESKPDLLVLDLSLPGLNGLELCRKLRADPETATLPVLMLSGWAFDSDVQAGLDAGADDYVTKPFHGPELVARAETLLARRAAAPAPASSGRARPAPAPTTEPEPP
jgi:DNA-binding response OmpR family regulator